MGNPAQWFRTVRERLRSGLRRYRERHLWFDHLLRAGQRYEDRHGDRLAASVTYYGILAFFPLIALAYAIVGYAVTFSPDAADYVTQIIDELVPGLADEKMIDQIASAKAGAGIIGLAGLSWAGTGWISALRDAVRELWMLTTDRASFVWSKVIDLAGLVAFGTALLASVLLSSVATSATNVVLDQFGLADSTVAHVLIRLLAIGVSVTADTAILLVLFGWLSGAREAPRSSARTTFRAFLHGAVVGAAGLAVLKLAGTFLIGFTTGNPVYGTFALLLGVLVWIYITTRWLLFAAAWTATTAGGPAPVPSPLPLPADAVPEQRDAEEPEASGDRGGDDRSVRN